MKECITHATFHNETIALIEEICGENIYKCYQCGKCTAGCPAAEEMDMGPAEAIRLLQLGLVERVLSSKAIWYCASCVMCYGRCPKGVDFSKIAEACRMILLRRGESRLEVQDFDIEYRMKAPQIAFISSSRKFSSLS
jgi:heterodisulfide reductase subunit C